MVKGQEESSGDEYQLSQETIAGTLPTMSSPIQQGQLAWGLEMVKWSISYIKQHTQGTADLQYMTVSNPRWLLPEKKTTSRSIQLTELSSRVQ